MHQGVIWEESLNKWVCSDLREGAKVPEQIQFRAEEHLSTKALKQADMFGENASYDII